VVAYVNTLCIGYGGNGKLRQRSDTLPTTFDGNGAELLDQH